MRQNNTQSFGQLLNVHQFSKNEIGRNMIIKPNLPTKHQLWNSFIKTFRELHDKEFDDHKDAINNLKVMFYYFLEDPQFFNCENLITEFNKPDLKKGLLLMGGVGTGKTDFLLIFEEMFKNYEPLRFKRYSSKALVQDYEKCSTPIDKDYFFKDKDRKRLFIDDIGSENNASNYGIYNVVENILYNSYEKKRIIYVSTNFASSNNCVRETLEALGLRYGHRIYDRLFEMFNIIIFNGKSFR